jgi:hypothetical protein
MLLNTNRNGKEMNNNLNVVICVFCEGYVGDAISYTETQYCVPCNEYKGITTVGEYFEETGRVLVFA